MASVPTVSVVDPVTGGTVVVNVSDADEWLAKRQAKVPKAEPPKAPKRRKARFSPAAEAVVEEFPVEGSLQTVPEAE